MENQQSWRAEGHYLNSLGFQNTWAGPQTHTILQSFVQKEDTFLGLYMFIRLTNMSVLIAFLDSYVILNYTF